MTSAPNTAMRTTTLPLSALQPNDYNPNSMTDERFAELVEEVRHLGRLPASRMVTMSCKPISPGSAATG